MRIDLSTLGTITMGVAQRLCSTFLVVQGSLILLPPVARHWSCLFINWLCSSLHSNCGFVFPWSTSKSLEYLFCNLSIGLDLPIEKSLPQSNFVFSQIRMAYHLSLLPMAIVLLGTILNCNSQLAYQIQFIS